MTYICLIKQQKLNQMKTLNRSKKISTTIAMLFIACVSFSQINKLNPEKYVAANSKITSVAESEKFLWIGTNNGVVRVSKKNEKIIHFNVSNSKLPSNDVTSICVRKDGNVWIGTANGILRYDQFAYVIVNTENSLLSENKITSIVEDKNNDLWIGTHTGLVRVHNSKFQVFNQKNSPSLASDNIVSLSTDESGNLCINK